MTQLSISQQTTHSPNQTDRDQKLPQGDVIGVFQAQLTSMQSAGVTKILRDVPLEIMDHAGEVRSQVRKQRVKENAQKQVAEEAQDLRLQRKSNLRAQLADSSPGADLKGAQLSDQIKQQEIRSQRKAPAKHAQVQRSDNASPRADSSSATRAQGQPVSDQASSGFNSSGPVSTAEPVSDGTHQSGAGSSRADQAVQANAGAASSTAQQPVQTGKNGISSVPSVRAGADSAAGGRLTDAGVVRVNPAGNAGDRSSMTNGRLAQGASAGKGQRAAGADEAQLFGAQLRRGMAAVLKQGATQGNGRVTLRLRPEALGELKIQMDMKEGVVQARFEVTTQQARGLLDEHLPALRAALQARGLAVHRLEVSVMLEGKAQSYIDEQQESSGQDARAGQHGNGSHGGDEAHAQLAGSGTGRWGGGERASGGADAKTNGHLDIEDRSQGHAQLTEDAVIDGRVDAIA